MTAPTSPSAPPLPQIAAALGTGALMTLMLLCNSAMAAAAGPLFASLTAHGVGTVFAAILLLWLRGRGSRAGLPRGRAPLWAYLGGLSGALTVVATSWTANTPLALTGTLALGLAGQVVLALVFDLTGAMGLVRRRPAGSEILAIGLICAGAALVILARRTGA
ncbi:DMT family transporter [Mangrovicoccus algicola]|uniref:DMT family transporter n=1 Tax=Mangrovicoccus algicola TaxID=2771008 RepID=A0A8J6YZA0_9RHOB|nr:DMT family transporter [Mangrovicoccus algicola]MBE3640567.1 DMT family transporter [Mangrovicoccus algicola]